MKKVIRIGIIDSGISLKEKELLKYIHGYVNVENRSRSLDFINDDIGHGTTIVRILTEGHSPKDIHLYIYKIFGKTRSQNFHVMNRALKYALLDRIDILNCSCGTVDPDAEFCLRENTELLLSRGTVVVSSWSVRNFVTWPANFDGVISTKSDNRLNVPEWSLEKDHREHFLFSGKMFLPGNSKNTYIEKNGSSIATALCTRKILDSVIKNEVKLDLNSIVSYMKRNAQKVEQTDRF